MKTLYVCLLVMLTCLCAWAQVSTTTELLWVHPVTRDQGNAALRLTNTANEFAGTFSGTIGGTNAFATTNYVQTQVAIIETAKVSVVTYGSHTNALIAAAHTGVLTHAQLPPGVLTNYVTTYTPYIVPFATSNNIVLSNGPWQYMACSNTTTIYMPAASTNSGHSLRVDIDKGTNSFTVATNGFCVVDMGTAYVTNNGIGVLIFDKPYNSALWKVYTLP